MVFDFNLSFLYYVRKEKRTGRKVLLCTTVWSAGTINASQALTVFEIFVYGTAYITVISYVCYVVSEVSKRSLNLEFSSYFSVRLKEFQDVFNTPVLKVINIPVPRSYSFSYSINIPDSMDHKKKKMKTMTKISGFGNFNAMTDQSYIPFRVPNICLPVCQPPLLPAFQKSVIFGKVSTKKILGQMRFEATVFSSMK